MKGLNFSTFKNIEKSIKEDSIIDFVEKRITLSKENREEIEDLIKEIKDKDGIISKEGIVTCYYALSKYNKKSYEKTGDVGAGSDKIVVSTKNTSDLKKFGDTILTLYIPIEKLYFTASTKDSVLLKIPFRSSYRRMNIKQYTKDEI